MIFVFILFNDDIKMITTSVEINKANLMLMYYEKIQRSFLKVNLPNVFKP